jgi:hypothetical protein
VKEMKLIYRGIQYDEKDRAAMPSNTGINSKDIVYRGNSPKARVNLKFIWLKYIKQLFSYPKSEVIFDPLTFWYEYQKQFLEDMWRDDREMLDRAWNLTIEIEQAQALKAQQKTKFKYRGVTYYR